MGVDWCTNLSMWLGDSWFVCPWSPELEKFSSCSTPSQYADVFTSSEALLTLSFWDFYEAFINRHDWLLTPLLSHKKRCNLTFATMWTDLEGIMLRETSQRKKSTVWFYWNVLKIIVPFNKHMFFMLISNGSIIIV